MKTRTGFVSNSSSSSFIIATKGTKKFSVKIEVDLAEYTDEVLSTPSDVKEYFAKEWGDDKLTSNLAKKCIQAVSNGKKVFVGSFDSESEDSIEQLLCEVGIPKDTSGIEIIQNEGGY